MRSTILLFLAASVGLVAVPGRTLVGQAAYDVNKALADYQLAMPKADKLIASVVPMKKYLLTLPGGTISFNRLPYDTRIARLKSDPKAVAILKETGLTVEDYMIGLPALRMALRTAEDGTGATESVSAVNLAFAKAHMDLKPKLDAADATNP